MFERVYDYRNLYEAYIKARKQKRYRGEVLQFSYALEENLIALQNELIWKTYKVGAYRPFVIYEPKKRQTARGWATPQIPQVTRPSRRSCWTACIIYIANL